MTRLILMMMRYDAGPSSDAVAAHFNLPSDMFASATEEDIGLLNRAAPIGLPLDWDPDVVCMRFLC